MKKLRRGFWRELISRDNSVVNTMAIISLVISAPIIALSCAALIYDIWVLDYGLTDPSVKLLICLIGAATGGLSISQFSKRTYTEMSGILPSGGEESSRPPGPRGPKLDPGS
jgi:hypothetical protein